jgi:hypothetical protein
VYDESGHLIGEYDGSGNLIEGKRTVLAALKSGH